MNFARSRAMLGREVMRAALLVLAAACASSPVPAPRTQVHLEPVKAVAPEAAEPLPALTSLAGGGASVAVRAEPRLTELSAVNQDVSVVVRQLAAKFGLQYQIDPAVRGTVNTTLRNKTLNEALAAIVPHGATYQIQDGVLRVGPARISTRIFSLDYVALSRVGTASTIIQRRLSSSSLGTTLGGSTVGGAGANANLAAGGGADIISAVSVADVWEEIRVATEALVFDTLSAGGSTTQQGAQVTTSAGTGTTGRPYSRVSRDGRRLIINPIAGTITVSAFPAQLDEIEVFIRAFETSIQRQVLIEAKIVEVNLDRSFSFGIDWSAIARAGTADFSARAAPPASAGSSGGTGNVKVTLTGGPGEITAVLDALSTQGDVRVLSSPRVSALNNQRAVFDVTTGEIVFVLNRTPVTNAAGVTTFISQVTPTQVNVGIVLDVIPQIGADNAVTMNIRPVVTSVRRTATFTADNNTFEAPVIDTRESDTMARLRGGETIIIGGLMQTRRERVQSGIPGLRSIPLLGRLFTSYKDVDSKAELVIFLTPTIIAGSPLSSR